MAAKPPHLQVVCPPSRNGGGGGCRRQSREWRDKSACAKACAVAVLVLIGAALITGLAFLGIFLDREFPSKDPEFTVAITGVTGLDPVVDPPAALLSPVFNFAFQIDNTRNAYEACIPGLSRAQVSYGDAYLAGGSVPPFCAGEKKRTSGGGVAARAWGEDVTVPRFLRDQLAAELAAGDASVDVKVTMPKYCLNGWCSDAVLSCKAKIGGGTSPACRLDFV